MNKVILGLTMSAILSTSVHAMILENAKVIHHKPSVSKLLISASFIDKVSEQTRMKPLSAFDEEEIMSLSGKPLSDVVSGNTNSTTTITMHTVADVINGFSDTRRYWIRYYLCIAEIPRACVTRSDEAYITGKGHFNITQDISMQYKFTTPGIYTAKIYTNLVKTDSGEFYTSSTDGKVIITE